MPTKGATATIQPENILENTFEYRFDDESFIITKSGHRIDISRRGSHKPFAVIRLGGPASGSIWVGDECIAEFERQKNDYVVTPIRDSRKKPDETVQVDPLTFVLEQTRERPKHRQRRITRGH